MAARSFNQIATSSASRRNSNNFLLSTRRRRRSTANSRSCRYLLSMDICCRWMFLLSKWPLFTSPLLKAPSSVMVCPKFSMSKSNASNFFNIVWTASSSRPRSELTSKGFFSLIQDSASATFV
ncbi:hypothetical protein NP493_185g02017 [Ridgeia piscesae]|uniref:Uncharacterized protein n=1 Tax=Ridgeia piscesae TaxID=27915 RepID=A0AAD9P2F1_RIDPI|nr:hypothetical protein NP493_185g02017 [Ridgeia piscesae]